MDLDTLVSKILPFLSTIILSFIGYYQAKAKTKSDKEKDEYDRLIAENNRTKSDLEYYRKRWRTAEDELDQLKHKVDVRSGTSIISNTNLKSERKDKNE